jgi:hypothetical protein
LGQLLTAAITAQFAKGLCHSQQILVDFYTTRLGRHFAMGTSHFAYGHFAYVAFCLQIF